MSLRDVLKKTFSKFKKEDFTEDSAFDEIKSNLKKKKGLSNEEAEEQAGKILSSNKNKKKNFISVYHETPKKNIESIKEKGLSPPSHVNPAKWYMVTTSRKGAEEYRGDKEENVILKYKIPIERKNEYLWMKASSESEIYGKQIGIRKPLPKEYLSKVIPYKRETIESRTERLLKNKGYHLYKSTIGILKKEYELYKQGKENELEYWLPRFEEKYKRNKEKDEKESKRKEEFETNYLKLAYGDLTKEQLQKELKVRKQRSEEYHQKHSKLRRDERTQRRATLINRINENAKEMMDIQKVLENYDKYKRDLIEDAKGNVGRPRKRGLHKHTTGAYLSGAKRTTTESGLKRAGITTSIKPEELKSTFPGIYETKPEYWVKAETELLPLPSLVSPEGFEVKGAPSLTDRPLTPVMSSTVMGKAVKGNKLYIQFHGSEQYIYKYLMPSEQVALQAFEDISKGSPGRWVWKNIRGSELGPVFGKPNRETIGGTSASLIPYDKMRHSRVKPFLEEIPNYENIAKQMQEYKMGVKEQLEGATSAEPFAIEEIKAFQRGTPLSKEEINEFQRRMALESLRKMFREQAKIDFVPLKFNEIIGLWLRPIHKLIEIESPIHDYIPLSKFKQLKNDFSNDFTILHGPIVRDGPYTYYDKNGKETILYKDWDNLKDVYGRYDYLILRGTTKKGAHHAEEIGFGYNFEPDEETHTINSDIILLKDIENSTSLLNPKEGYHVSPGYIDKIEGNVQYIKDLDHIAISLENKEKARACTGSNEKGSSCTTVRVKDNDQNLMEVVN